MEALEIIIILVLSATVSILFGNILSVIMPRLSDIFDRKPFNCRPCFTFHLTWILTGISALATSSLKLFIAGIIIAFIVFFIIRHIDNKKIVK